MRGMVFLKLSVFYLRLSFLQFMLLAPFTRVRWPQLMICFCLFPESSLPLVTCPCPSTMLALLVWLQHHLSRYYDTPVLLSLLGFLWLSWDCHGGAMEAVKVWPVFTTACVWRSETTCRGWFSPTVWILGLQLRFSSLTTGPFPSKSTYWFLFFFQNMWYIFLDRIKMVCIRSFNPVTFANKWSHWVFLQWAKG